MVESGRTQMTIWRMRMRHAKPKCYLGAETCARRKSTSPCLLAIPVFDRIAGLSNRHLNSNRGICLRLMYPAYNAYALCMLDT